LLYIKKEQIKFTGVICASLILVIGSFFQLLPTNPFGNNYDILITIPLIYADDDCKDDKDDDCKDDKDDDCKDDKDDDCKDDKDDDCKDDKDEDSGNIDSENEQDTDNESVENDNEDTTKNLNTDNDNNRISTPAEDSSTSPPSLPSSTTTLQNDNNDNEILTSTITNEKQSTPYINLTQLDNTKTEGEHVMANKTAKNTNENSLANVIKSKQQQLQQLQLQLQLQQQQQQQIQQQQQERNEQKTENIRIITTLINSPEQLTGKAKVTVTFNEDENKQVTFQSNNKTITAEEETVFPLTLVKTVNKEAEEQPSTMNVCAVIEGFENTCDTVLLQENQTKPYRVTLELINFEELEPVS
jgi:hypothetical protein